MMKHIERSDQKMAMIIMILAIGVPIVLSVLNIVCFCSNKGSAKIYKVSSTLTVFVGGFLYLLLYCLMFDPGGDWNEQVYSFQTHYSVSTEYMPTLIILALVGLVGYFTLLFGSAEKLPPLVSVFCVAAVIMINVLHIAHAIQISNSIPVNQDVFILFYVYHANLLLISATTLRKHIREMLVVAKNKGMDVSDNVKYRWIYAKMTKFSHYTILAFVALFILIAVLEIIFVLCGQGLDAPIKAFTDTADWTFSQQTPPPPMYYDGHYLCTVAAGGHRKVVKPLRYGTRLGETIIVNRQLCVANAFEDYIKEKLPRFHRFIRGVYDKYGYPISKHITNPTRADVVYFLMKPLEWAFVAFLYLFDVQPEKRISRQYKYCGK